jgi:alpha-mannosidase
MNILSSRSEKITAIIEKLRQLTQIDVQANWYYLDNDLPNSCRGEWPFAPTTSDWQLAPLNDKGYIIWSAGRQVRWLTQQIVIPHHLQNYALQGFSLRLALTWWAEDAQIFVNGTLVQQGDLFDSSARILLTRSATPGEEITVTIRLVSPGHDIGALMRSKLIYEVDCRREWLLAPTGMKGENYLDPGFIADELTVLQKYLENFEADKLHLFERELEKIDWNVIANREKFDRNLTTLRQNLLPLAENLKQRSLNLLGHAHLDMAWLWTSSETYEVGQRTFASVLNLQQEYPYLTFCHTSPALYAWIEENNPDLFAAIQNAIEQEKWEVLGGMWVEPEVNITSGESLVRQLLYGQNYCLEKFGAIAKIAWLPDSFGFTWQLPQIFKQAGIDYFVTGKLHWNDTNQFPHGCFWWRAPDGTEILTLMSPPNLTGVMDTNPITMANYAVSWEQQTGLKESFWLPGVGDHGGGPTRDMLEVQERWQHSPFFPRIEFTTAIDYLEKISLNAETNVGTRMPTQGTSLHKEFPVWNDELYLELHRGCYTTHADRKRFNRYCEGLLYQAELFAAIALTVDRDLHSQQWQQKIDEAWKKVLFNQFHDILPGTSIREVFVEADRTDREAIAIAENILAESLQAIANQIQLPSPPKPNAKPIIIFNSLNWERSELVPLSSLGEIYDLEGKQIPTQIIDEQELVFFAQNIPSVGYRLFWFFEREQGAGSREQGAGNGNQRGGEAEGQRSEEDRFNSSLLVLENEYLKVTVNSETGDLDSIFDKINQKEILSAAGNQLQAFVDRGQYWDAWNINPNYEQHSLAPTQLKSIACLDNGILQQRIRVIRQLNKSEFTQDYILQANSPILKIATIVDWQEEHVMVKAAFPLTLTSNSTAYEIACGAIERPNNSEEPHQQAKWEVAALHWADLTDSEQNYGISLLNDCKYGYDSQGDRLRLTLLRSPRWPDPEADKGFHQFTYAIYPHTNSWQSAQTVCQGYQLNIPLQVLLWEPDRTRRTNKLPTVGKFIDLQAENLILMALKSSDRDNLILRFYECHGKTANFNLESDLNLALGDRLNLLEQPIQNETTNHIKPWQIASFELEKGIRD